MAGPSLFDRGPLVATLALTALGLSVLNTAILLKHQFGSDETVFCRAMPFPAPSPPMLFEHEHEHSPRHEAPRRHRFRYHFNRPEHRPHEEAAGSARFQTLFLTDPAYHGAPRFEFFTCP